MTAIFIYTLLMLAATFVFGFAVAFLIRSIAGALYYFSAHTIHDAIRHISNQVKEIFSPSVQRVKEARKTENFTSLPDFHRSYGADNSSRADFRYSRGTDDNQYKIIDYYYGVH